MVIILVTGIPGSGKSYFSKKLATLLHKPRLSISDIVFAIAKEQFPTISRDTIRTLPIPAIKEIHKLTKHKIQEIIQQESCVIMDDNYMVKGEKNTLIQPPEDYFLMYKIQGVILLDIPASQIINNLEKDKIKRKRDVSSGDDIIKFQSEFNNKLIPKTDQQGILLLMIPDTNTKSLDKAKDFVRSLN